MIITPNMLKSTEAGNFTEKYIDRIPEISLSAPFKKGKEIHALANYYLLGQNISKLENSLEAETKEIWNNLKTNKYFCMNLINSEYTISAKLGNFWIGGRIDAIVEDCKNYYILDYKTGQIPKNPVYDFQTMVYTYCMDKMLKNYSSLNFVYLGVKTKTDEKVIFTSELKKEYENRLMMACLQIQKLL